MHCRQTERRLQQLLDSRQAVDADPMLREHIEWCRPCATLATAYGLLAREPLAGQSSKPSSKASAPLADRVLAELNAQPLALANQSQRKSWRPSWQTWSTVAVAASVLVAVGIAFGPRGTSITPTADERLADTTRTSTETPATETMVAGAQPAHADSVRPVVQGRDMWFRTGQGLASISFAGLRSQQPTSAEPETPSDDQLLDRAFDTIRTLWPREGESQNPTRGETGWRAPGGDLVLVG